MKKYNLNIIISPERCSLKDFMEISEKIKSKSDDINVSLSCLFPEDLQVEEVDDLDEEDLNLPSLTVSLVNLPGFDPPGRLIMSSPVDKITQFNTFISNNINTPLTKMYSSQINFDLFDEYAFLKPFHPRLQSIKEHLLVKSVSELKEEKKEYHEKYIIQQFIDSGEYPSIFRVLTLFDEVLYLCKISGCIKKENNKVPSNFNNKERDPDINAHEFIHDEDVYQFGKLIASAFKNKPLLGIDIIREESTGKLYAIEVNAGGNVWHFSSNSRSIENHPHLAEKRINQYSAFDRAAEALINATRLYAS